MSLLIDKLDTAVAPETEIVDSCPLCGDAKSEFLFWNCDRLYQLPGKFGVVQCQTCTLVRLSPRPKKENLPFYYPQTEYYSYLEPKASIKTIYAGGPLVRIRDMIRDTVLVGLGYETSQLSRVQRLFQPILMSLFLKPSTYGYGRKFPRFVKNGKALEIGCGNGAFLSYLKHHGWAVVGVELSEAAAASAKANFDIDVFVDDLEKIPFMPASFDFIRLNHVVEHLPDPVATLSKVQELLKPGGTLYIEVPNWQSYASKVGKQYWFHLDSPRHLYMFSPSSFLRLLDEAQLKPKSVITVVENVFDMSMTYREEEKTGGKFEARPVSSIRLSFGHSLRFFYSKMRSLVVDGGGDIICCWATRK